MPFQWDAVLGRYRTADGPLVREDVIRAALDDVIDAQALQMRALTQSLVDGSLSLSAWQAGMLQNIKVSHLIGTAAAAGGWREMDPSWNGWVGQRIRTQVSFARGFAADIASGRQKLDGTALARSTLYAEAARQTHRAAQQRLAAQRGVEQEANRLGASDHCPGCLAQTSRGWVALGSLVPCGNRDCKVRCHCSLAFRMKPAA